MNRETVFSEDRRYRYTLWRQWSDDLFKNRIKSGYVMWIGLNPSTADETLDDPTIRKCMGFTKRWGYLTMCMTNLFAFRATDPKKMMLQPDPVGSENDRWLREVSAEAEMVVCAWGTKGNHRYRALYVAGIIGPGTHCLRRTKFGFPEHPLYVPYSAQPIQSPVPEIISPAGRHNDSAH